MAFKIETVASSKLKGEKWDDVDQGDIAMIFISYGRIISHLQFLYVKNGNFSLSGKHGDLIEHLEIIKLDYPSEYLIGVNGRHGVIGTDRVLKSITFVTNKNSYGPFPKNKPTYMGSEDTEFNINVGNYGWLNGFHGTICNGQLESFGVYINPIPISKDIDYDKIDVVDC
ncbi:PREDICTED: inactive protein RESTRICTED TEV MOVEMENT 1-like [Nicotiana attenuata]|uniref:Inactive protein restricted tev movement 1 n=1 Tax=Nicotiana attenuata TaxID=49451 RepID=A0A314KP80_NICAT|nr:PREDICTED: inactive protein RESTRICTED TEV MOVEMENT 1-like [Nicotiana attenuata]OIT31241.1 inactive protein restricted tev movement 1 [Nicotiana attenuata]